MQLLQKLWGKPACPPLEICQLGNPLLRQVAQPIEDVRSPAIQQLFDDLLELVKQKKGMGIAAPQVGRSLALLVISSHPNERYPYAPTMAPMILANPKIVARSGEVVKGWEGCLSVPGIRGMVPRHTCIEVEYLNRDGDLESRLFTDFIARIFQHEYDHLEGMVFLDRVESSRELIAEAEFLKLNSLL